MIAVKRDRRGGWFGLVVAGLMLGFAVGIGVGIVYAWNVNPVVQSNVAPWQLDSNGQKAWLIAVSVAWARDGDLVAAANRLNDLRWGSDTFSKVAQAACELARSSYAQSQSGLLAIRSMAALAEGQGQTSCAAEVVALSTSTLTPTSTPAPITPTLVPPATKTPFPTLGTTFTPATDTPFPPTLPPSDFRPIRTDAYCNPQLPSLLEVLVQDSSGTGIPGVEIQVDSTEGSDHFFTGLELDHDPGYADFHMKPDLTYTVTLTGSPAHSDPLTASPCTQRGSGSSITSYRVYFRRVVR